MHLRNEANISQSNQKQLEHVKLFKEIHHSCVDNNGRPCVFTARQPSQLTHEVDRRLTARRCQGNEHMEKENTREEQHGSHSKLQVNIFSYPLQ